MLCRGAGKNMGSARVILICSEKFLSHCKLDGAVAVRANLR